MRRPPSIRPTSRRATALAGALVLLAGACSNGDDGPDEGGTGDEVAVDEPDASFPPACDEVRGIDDDTIRLGVFADLSGPIADTVGVLIEPTMSAYFDTVNAEGGIGGRQVELDVRDVRMSTVDAGTQYEQLRDEVAMLPFMLLPDMVGALADDLAEDCLLTFIGPQNGQLPQAHETVFAPGTAGSHELINLVDWVVENEDGADEATWALAYPTDGSGDELLAGAQHVAEWHDLDYVETVTFASTDQDLTGQAQSLLAADPDYVVYGGTFVQLASLLPAVVAGGGEMQFLTYTSGSPQVLLPTPAGPMVIEHTLLSSSYNVWVEDSPALDALDAGLADSAVPEPFRRSMQTLGLWNASALAHATLEAAVAADDLTLGGLRRAAEGLEVDTDAMTPPLRYGRYEDAPRLPTKASRVMRVDPDGAAGLAPVSEWFTSEAAEAFTPPS